MKNELHFPTSQIFLHAVIAIYAKDGDATILAGLSKSEEHSPQHTLSCSTDRQQHLGERQNVKWYAAQQHYDTGTERE